ncbi:MAG: hypothetical protein VCA36_11635, partial [Opitutales bacterium]
VCSSDLKGLVRKAGIRTQTTPDPIAFNQVPKRNLGEAQKAANDLHLARERNTLAELHKDLAKIEAELTEFESKVTLSRLNQRDALFKKAQFEAIDASGLGDKEENIVAIGKLASRAAKHEASALKDDSRATILRRRAEQSRAKVEAQAERVAGLEGSPL